MDITLALGGGGSKGYAHIGVLKVLQREGIRVRALAGTSMGGVIGCAYAAGLQPLEIEEFMAALDQQTLYARSPDDGPAMMGLTGVAEALTEAFGEGSFDDLVIPFAVTAVDLETADLLALKRGKLREALLATIAVPGVFPVKTWNGRHLIDGGILDPVPVALARSLAPDLPVVAVVLSPPYNGWTRKPPPRLLTSLPFLGRYLARLRLAKALNVFLNAVDISGTLLTDLRLKQDTPDLVIRPQIHHIGLVDPVDVKAISRIGEQATEAALPELRRLRLAPLRLYRRLKHWMMQEQSSRYVT